MWDVNSSFNLIDESFDKLGLDYFLDRNLYDTVSAALSTSFTSKTPSKPTYSNTSSSSATFSNVNSPASTSYSTVSNPQSTTWSGV
tara:strand:+ start:2330 stop:2587 length:258 start_codon:yes stop_codon:yes gene_type:complete